MLAWIALYVKVTEKWAFLLVYLLYKNMFRLVDADGELRVSVAIEGTLVDVCAAHEQVRVVHDHQLGMHVDHESTRPAQLGRPRAHGGAPQQGGRLLLAGLLLPKTEEHEVVGGVGGRGGRRGVQSLRDSRVHHLHGTPLPEEDLLDGRVRGDALGVHGDHDVNGEAVDEETKKIQRFSTTPWCQRVIIPEQLSCDGLCSPSTAHT